MVSILQAEYRHPDIPGHLPRLQAGGRRVPAIHILSIILNISVVLIQADEGARPVGEEQIPLRLRIRRAKIGRDRHTGQTVFFVGLADFPRHQGDFHAILAKVDLHRDEKALPLKLELHPESSVDACHRSTALVHAGGFAIERADIPERVRIADLD